MRKGRKWMNTLLGQGCSVEVCLTYPMFCTARDRAWFSNFTPHLPRHLQTQPDSLAPSVLSTAVSKFYAFYLGLTCLVFSLIVLLMLDAQKARLLPSLSDCIVECEGKLAIKRCLRKSRISTSFIIL